MILTILTISTILTNRYLFPGSTILEKISVHHTDLTGKWLKKKYPQLKYLELIPENVYITNWLNGCLEENTSIATFSTSALCLFANRNDFLESKAKLKELEVKFYKGDIYADNSVSGFNIEPEELSFESICEILKKLYKNNFYQIVNLYVETFDRTMDEQLELVEGLGKIRMHQKDH